MGWEMGEGFKREGTYVYLWLIHADVWQKPSKYCKAIILQLKKIKNIYSFSDYFSLIDYYRILGRVLCVIQ